jgi:hypothetical protein
MPKYARSYIQQQQQQKQQQRRVVLPKDTRLYYSLYILAATSSLA